MQESAPTNWRFVAEILSIAGSGVDAMSAVTKQLLKECGRLQISVFAQVYENGCFTILL